MNKSISTIVVIVIFVAISLLNCNANTPYRIVQTIQIIPHFGDDKNPKIISAIEQDQSFCLLLDNVIDTLQLAIDVMYDIDKNHIGYECIIIKYGKEPQRAIFHSWNSLEKKENYLSAVFKQQSEIINSWINKIHLNTIFSQKGRTCFINKQQYYHLFFRYFLIPNYKKER